MSAAAYLQFLLHLPLGVCISLFVLSAQTLLYSLCLALSTDPWTGAVVHFSLGLNAVYSCFLLLVQGIVKSSVPKLWVPTCLLSLLIPSLLSLLLIIQTWLVN
ncbi:hypothetical protein SAMN05421831_10157 [Allopseudospirillum japonicum]|uniref:Uncharacterized protein n=1 Tax=Allopseudospirillum japonicum TaxID=64971 RepID=A0A1H6Q9N9_9GAMM|nr:hypothetical protein [Allopseudospirillum japonicum]SEI37534.1 hypothetical protein SAMN05421831_10157 [Allopseudospirillum japonicum]